MRLSAGLGMLALAAALSPVSTAIAAPTAVMAWERTPVRPGVAFAGYDLSPDGRAVAVSVCGDGGACLIALLDGSGPAKILRPPANVAWRAPRFIDDDTLLILEIPAENGLWSSEHTRLVRLDRATGRRTLLLDAAFISSAAPLPGGGVAFAEATGSIDLPLTPGRQRKPVRFALFRVNADGSGKRRLGQTVFDTVEDLTHIPGVGLVFNAMASSYGGQTAAFSAATPGGPPANGAAVADPETGRIAPLVASPGPGVVWFGGVAADGVIVGRSEAKIWRKPLRARTSTLGDVTPGRPAITIKGMRPGVVRAAAGAPRGLLLINDPAGGANRFDLAWIDFRTGGVTRDARLTDAALKAGQAHR